MALRNFSSTAAETTLAAGISSANTTIQVAATTGFPSVPFILALDAGAAAQELVLVTNVAGTTLTVTRGYDSTVASAHEVGATVAHSHGGIDFREANAHVNANSGVHGATGDVVGTTDTQTLTNKTLALGSNTVSGTKAQFNTAMTDDDFATLTGTETLTNKTLTAPTLTAPVATGSLTGFGGAWTAYTPTLTGATQGNGTLTGGYVQVGKTVHFWAKFVLGSTSSVAGSSIGLSLPVTAKGASNYSSLQGLFTDSGTGNFIPACTLSTTTASLWAVQTGGAHASLGVVNATTPHTWASTDEIEVHGSYEAA